MPNVLILAYYFPPAGGAGVQRTLKFVKYLPEFGWNPIVLTARDRRSGLRDAALGSELPPSLDVYRTGALMMPGWLPWKLRNFLTRWFLLVDEQVGWVPFAVSQGRKIIEEIKISAIYSTFSPGSNHLAALRLQRASGIPWIADFRDPWVGNFAATYPTPFHRGLVARLEGSVCREAAFVTVVSEPMRSSLVASYPDLDPAKVITLPNGYDPFDFNGVQPAALDWSVFNIVYTGSFYPRHRSPETFLKALRHILDAGLISPEALRLHLIGNLGQAAEQAVSGLGLGDVVMMPGYLPHSESIAYLLAADALFLLSGSTAVGESSTTPPAKAYEYLATGKPVLALAPPGPTAELIQEAGAGVVVDPEDTAAIQAAILNLYQKWRSGALRCDSRTEVIQRYDRRQLTRRLASLLDEAQNERTKP